LSEYLDVGGNSARYYQGARCPFVRPAIGFVAIWAIARRFRFAAALFRALTVCLLFLALGLLEDMRLTPGSFALGLLICAGTLLIFGTIAFVQAWIWAGKPGPVQRLTARACGAAIYCMSTAVVTIHAIYFGWVNSIEGPCHREIPVLVSRCFH
jgi:hypothetical protein